MKVVSALGIQEERKRRGKGHIDRYIPIHLDHGHLMGDKIDQVGVNPTYSYVGHIKGLAELRGVIHTL